MVSSYRTCRWITLPFFIYTKSWYMYICKDGTLGKQYLVFTFSPKCRRCLLCICLRQLQSIPRELVLDKWMHPSAISWIEHLQIWWRNNDIQISYGIAVSFIITHHFNIFAIEMNRISTTCDFTMTSALIFVSLFIEEIWGWKLNSGKFSYSYYKNHSRKTIFSSFIVE